MTRTRRAVYLIDDHPVVEAGLRLGFDVAGGFEVIGVSLTPHDAIERLPRLDPAVVLCDLVIDGEADLGHLALYRAAAPGARIVAFSSLDPELYAPRCVAAGADGFVPKSVSPHEIARTLARILSKPRAAGAPEAVDAAWAMPTLDGVHLTPRETEVAELLARGTAVTEIAAALGISKKTAAIHRDNIRAKLSCASSNELIATLARMSGLNAAPE